MIDFSNPDWLRGFAEHAAEDQELDVIGKYFTTSFWLTIGEQRYVFEVREGRLLKIHHNPPLDVRSIFGFRGPTEDWEKFFSPNPQPLYNEPFGMLMRVPTFKAEGDTLAFAQNARALHRFLKLLGEFGGRRHG